MLMLVSQLVVLGLGVWIFLSIVFIVIFIPEHKVGLALMKQVQFICPCGFSKLPKLFSLAEALEKKILSYITKTERRKDALMLVLLFFLPAIMLLLVKDILIILYHKKGCLPYHVGSVGKE